MIFRGTSQSTYHIDTCVTILHVCECVWRLYLGALTSKVVSLSLSAGPPSCVSVL